MATQYTVQHPAFPDTTRVVDDPAPWTEQGWILLSDAEAEQVQHEADPNVPVRPDGNASREDWLAYATAQPNADVEQLEGMTRNQIRDSFAD